MKSKMIQLHQIKLPKKPNTKNTAEYIMNIGVMDGRGGHALGPYNGIADVWKNQPCYIIGGGPSLNTIIESAGWDFFDGKNTIGINHVIEDYDRFKWFFFLDKRFLNKTTYNMENFKGRIFARNTTGLRPTEQITIFRTTDSEPSTKIEDGLFSGNLSGLAALNLAIITGANPIYLCGFGMVGTETAQSYHYKKDYTAEEKTEQRLEKFKRVNSFYSNFAYWKKRVKTIGSNLPPFGRVPFSALWEKEAGEKKPVIEVLGRDPVIAHLSFSGQVQRHADITRAVISQCHGKHSIHRFDKKIPDADLYILENFISTRDAVAKFPHKHKSINLVHSTNCWDTGPFLSTVCLTSTWQRRLAEHGVKAKTIRGGINLDDYTQLPDYSAQVFGRITRWSPGKIPKWWNEFVNNILDKNKSANCLMYVDFVNKNPVPLKRDRLSYDTSVRIFENKNPHLSKLSVYIHANGGFRETMSHSVIEAMATGLPIIYLYEGGVIKEVVGDAGIKCKNQDQLERELNAVLNNQGLRETLGKRSLQQAKMWDIKQTVKGFDEEIKRCLNALI